jgi:hypothetical protein
MATRLWFSRFASVVCERLENELKSEGFNIEGVAYRSLTSQVGVDFIVTPDAAGLALAQSVIDAHDGTDYDTIVSEQANDDAAAIPYWATWNVDSAETWWTDNLDTPLADARTSLAGMATLNLATFKAAMGIILDIMDTMSAMLWALARMVIALRNKQWPNLQERP